MFASHKSIKPATSRFDENSSPSAPPNKADSYFSRDSLSQSKSADRRKSSDRCEITSGVKPLSGVRSKRNWKNLSTSSGPEEGLTPSKRK